MADQRIQYTEEMVGAGHATKADSLNRLTLQFHNSDGSPKEAQPWVDKTSSRAVDTVYQNTLARDAEICVGCRSSVSGSACEFTLYVEDVNPPTVAVGIVKVQESGINAKAAVTATIPPGHYVKATKVGNTTLENWAEAPALS